MLLPERAVCVNLFSRARDYPSVLKAIIGRESFIGYALQDSLVVKVTETRMNLCFTALEDCPQCYPHTIPSFPSFPPIHSIHPIHPIHPFCLWRQCTKKGVVSSTARRHRRAPHRLFRVRRDACLVTRDASSDYATLQALCHSLL